MSTATAEKEITEGTTEGLGQVEFRTDSLEKKADELETEISKLQRAIQTRRDDYEHRLCPAQKKAEQEIVELREKYDRFISNGETEKADECLDLIKKARTKIKQLAKNVLTSLEDENFAELESQANELHKKVSVLCDETTENHLAARRLDERTSGLSGSMTYSVPHHFSQLQTESNKARKLAEQILSE